MRRRRRAPSRASSRPAPVVRQRGEQPEIRERAGEQPDRGDRQQRLRLRARLAVAVEHGTEPSSTWRSSCPRRGIAGVHAVGGVAQARQPSTVDPVPVAGGSGTRSRAGAAPSRRAWSCTPQGRSAPARGRSSRSRFAVNSTFGVSTEGRRTRSRSSGRGPEEPGDLDRDGTLLELREVTDVGVLAVGLQDTPVADLQLQLACGRLRERDLEERHLGRAWPLGDVRGDGAYPRRASGVAAGRRPRGAATPPPPPARGGSR